MIACNQFNFDSLLPQTFFGFYAVEADAGKIDGNLRFIKTGDGRAVYDVPPKGRQARDGIDFPTHIPGKFQGPSQQLRPMKSQLLPSTVEGG